MKLRLTLAAILTFCAISAPELAKAPTKVAAASNDTIADTASVYDPYESFNRSIFSFNQAADAYVFRPIAKGYRYITPSPIRNSIGHFSDNLGEPVNMVNSFLQGDFQRGMQSFWRFVINSSVGIGGLNDVAASAGIPAQEEDFGQTLPVWGVDSGPYLVLPLLGPSNFRDFGGYVTDIALDPKTYLLWNDGWAAFGVGAGQILVQRERLLDPIDDINQTSLDPYATFRSIYQQRRDAEIHNRSTDAPKL